MCLPRRQVKSVYMLPSLKVLTKSLKPLPVVKESEDEHGNIKVVIMSSQTLKCDIVSDMWISS